MEIIGTCAKCDGSVRASEDDEKKCLVCGWIDYGEVNGQRVVRHAEISMEKSRIKIRTWSIWVPILRTGYGIHGQAFHWSFKITIKYIDEGKKALAISATGCPHSVYRNSMPQKKFYAVRLSFQSQTGKKLLWLKDAIIEDRKEALHEIEIPSSYTGGHDGMFAPRANGTSGAGRKARDAWIAWFARATG